jgi:hypothetical protein
MATSRTAGRSYNPRSASIVDISSNLFTDIVDTRQHALFYGLVTYDTIIGDGRWFDGTGAPSALRDIGIRDGHVVAITPDDLDDAGHLRIGDQADLVVIDFQRLNAVFVGGRAVLPRRQGHRTRRQATHRSIPARRAQAPAVTVQESELASVS